jgi:hypothetical protein
MGFMNFSSMKKQIYKQIIDRILFVLHCSWDSRNAFLLLRHATVLPWYLTSDENGLYAWGRGHQATKKWKTTSQSSTLHVNFTFRLLGQFRRKVNGTRFGLHMAKSDTTNGVNENCYEGFRWTARSTCRRLFLSEVSIGATRLVTASYLKYMLNWANGVAMSRHDMTWQDMARHDKIWQDMTWHDKTWHDNMTRHDKIWQDIRHDTTWQHEKTCQDMPSHDMTRHDETWQDLTRDD